MSFLSTPVYCASGCRHCPNFDKPLNSFHRTINGVDWKTKCSTCSWPMHSIRCVPKNFQLLPEYQWVCYPCHHTALQQQQVNPSSTTTTAESDCGEPPSDSENLSIDMSDSLTLDTDVCSEQQPANTNHSSFPSVSAGAANNSPKSSMIDKMDKMINKQKVWSAPFWFNINNSIGGNEEEPVFVDICSVLRTGVPYIFPKHYSGLDSKDQLVVELRVAAIKAGFNLTKRSSKSQHQLQKSKLYGCSVTLACQHGRLHEPQLKKSVSSAATVAKKPRGRPPTNKAKSTNAKYRNKTNPKAKVNHSLTNPKKQKATTMRPRLKKDLCNFGFTLSMYKLDHPEYGGKWIVTPVGRSLESLLKCGQHCGHLCLKSSQLRVHIDCMTKGDKELAKQCAQLHFTPSSSSSLLTLRNVLGVEINFRQSQIASLNRKEKTALKLLGENASTAEKLIAAFDNRDDVNYLYVTYHPVDGLLVMSSENKKKLKKKVNWNDSELLKDEELKQIHKDNGLGSDGRLLLIFMWATAEELRLARMFPEYCACDTTFGTNKQKKELFTLAMLDGNNRAFNGARAFVPNGQSWTFHTLFKYCLPILWGPIIVQRMQLMMTDGCSQEYLSFINNSGKNKSFENAVNGLCYFHSGVVGFCTHVKPTVPIKGKHDKQDSVIETVKYWVYSWFFYVESQVEFNVSKALFFEWLEENKKKKILPVLTVMTIKTWVDNHLMPFESFWLNHTRLFVAGMDQRTSSTAEAMHWSMKSGFDGVRSGKHDKQDSVIETVKYWVYSWFFYVESQVEFNVSKALFFEWLEENKKKKILPVLTVMTIKTWVDNHLMPFESFWLNHTRLFVAGMDQRTSSTAEAMHWSMKSGFDGVRSGMNADVAAETMCDKSIRKTKDLENFNADQVTRTKLWTDDPSLQMITDWCSRRAEEQWKASFQYKIIKITENQFLVFKPILQEKTESDKKCDVTRFYRVRIVDIIDDKYCSCSCGLPARRKYPCRHMMSLFGKLDPEMYSVRWLIQFAHSFQREGNEELSDLFRHMEFEEFGRDRENGEHILVEKSLVEKMSEGVFNIDESKVPTTTEKELAERVHFWAGRDIAVVKGTVVPSFVVDDEGGNLDDYGSIGENFATEYNFHQCAETEAMFETDEAFMSQVELTQNSQAKAAQNLANSKETRDRTIVDLARQGLKCVENSNQMYEWYENEMRQLVSRATNRVVSLKDPDGNRSGIHFGESGKAKKKTDKRKRNSFG